MRAFRLDSGKSGPRVQRRVCKSSFAPATHSLLRFMASRGPQAHLMVSRQLIANASPRSRPPSALKNKIRTPSHLSYAGIIKIDREAMLIRSSGFGFSGQIAISASGRRQDRSRRQGRQSKEPKAGIAIGLSKARKKGKKFPSRRKNFNLLSTPASRVSRGRPSCFKRRSP
jgi:hypothetical protein